MEEKIKNVMDAVRCSKINNIRHIVRIKGQLITSSKPSDFVLVLECIVKKPIKEIPKSDWEVFGLYEDATNIDLQESNSYCICSHSIHKLHNVLYKPLNIVFQVGEDCVCKHISEELYLKLRRYSSFKNKIKCIDCKTIPIDRRKLCGKEGLCEDCMYKRQLEEENKKRKLEEENKKRQLEEENKKRKLQEEENKKIQRLKGEQEKLIKTVDKWVNFYGKIHKGITYKELIETEPKYCIWMYNKYSNLNYKVKEYLKIKLNIT